MYVELLQLFIQHKIEDELGYSLFYSKLLQASVRDLLMAYALVYLILHTLFSRNYTRTLGAYAAKQI